MFSYQVFLLLLSAVLLVNAIDIRTIAQVPIYSGPGGTVSIDYRSASTAYEYSKYESTTSFIIQSTSNPIYFYETITEAFGPPEAKVIEGDEVLKVVTFGAAASGYYFTVGEYWVDLPELSIYFDCLKDGTAVVQITIDAVLTDLDDGNSVVEEKIVLYMRKECLNTGYRDGFAIGKGEGKNDDVVHHGVVQSAWKLDAYELFHVHPTVIPFSEHSSTFRISISSADYGNQYFEEPLVDVANRDVLDLTVRGSADKGGIAIGVPQTLVFFYQCKEEGETTVSVSISLGFYGIIEFGFVKHCVDDGAEIAASSEPSGVINIGVSRNDYSNIVENSHTAPEWFSEEPRVIVGADDISSIFYISTLSGKEQPFLAPHVSVYPATAFKVTTSGTLRDGGVASGNPQRFIVNYICEKASEGRVVVTIQLPGFSTIEFGYTKVCKKLIRHTDNIWTANQILIALLGVLLTSLILGFYIYKRKATQVAGSNVKKFGK